MSESPRPAGQPGRIVQISEHIGGFMLLGSASIRALARPGLWWSNFLVEARRQAFGTLPLAVFLAALAGGVMSQQSGYQFDGSGGFPLWILGTVISASTITEMAPIMTGIAMVGVIGARIAAELASMRVTEQVDALEVIGRDPVPYLVVPRVLAGVFTGPVLTAFALAAGIVVGWLTAIAVTPVTSTDFWYGVRYYVRDFPPFFALIKGTLFGFSTTTIAAYTGLSARNGSEGVGRATTAAVVVMLTALLVIDLLCAPLLKLVRI